MTGSGAGPRVTLPLHPNWPHQGRTVIESITDDGAYRSQFVTGISNGGLTAYPGGEAAARRLGRPVEFHLGFRTTPDDIDPGYRGQHIVDLARTLGGVLTPAVIGDAARSGLHDPQHIKQVWHCLARFGRTP